MEYCIIVKMGKLQLNASTWMNLKNNAEWWKQVVQEYKSYDTII